ncbi:MAG: ParA family protein [SAR324 cluster bacterium]|nr:ParA family protein [SAR324 cluster bacterium]MCZ6627326.1 ParA family protein [SAR324 cluster bacterium]MCZ6842024.1 ParA family protein [SAR324 cluster bacterium]
MKAVSFLHQKGGTGKSTLAIGAATALAARGERVLLLDADHQGTSAEWGNRFGHGFKVSTGAHVQPGLEDALEGLARDQDWVIIDGPPSLSSITEGILRASNKVIIPVRPAPPDLWALPWLAAIAEKLRREGRGPQPLVVVNMHQGEPLEPVLAEIAELQLPTHPQPLPAHPAFPALFEGHALPEHLAKLLLDLLLD